LVRGALARIDDLNALKEHGFTELLARVLPQTEQSTGLRTRLFLLDLIERMRPAHDVAMQASEWRQYHILKERYELRQPLPDIEKKLSLSERQLRREHQRAIHGLTALAYTQLHRNVTDAPIDADHNPANLQEAVQRLLPSPCQFDVLPLISDVIGIVQQTLRNSPNLLNTPEIDIQAQSEVQMIFADRGILHQLLLKLCQLMVLKQAQVHGLLVQVNTNAQWVEITFKPDLKTNGALAYDPNEVQLCHWLATSLSTELVIEDCQARLSLPIKAEIHKVLIVDDEVLALNLYSTYLTNLNYEVITESKPEYAVARAMEVCPDVIVLDVMMPAMDGWELLQRLRHAPTLRDIPIVACSVLDDAALAQSLGATHFMKKPILRRQFIHVLEDLLQPRQPQPHSAEN